MLYDADGSQVAEKIFAPFNVAPGDTINLTWHLIYDADLGLILRP